MLQEVFEGGVYQPICLDPEEVSDGPQALVGGVSLSVHQECEVLWAHAEERSRTGAREVVKSHESGEGVDEVAVVGCHYCSSPSVAVEKMSQSAAADFSVPLLRVVSVIVSFVTRFPLHQSLIASPIRSASVALSSLPAAR